MGSNYLEGNWAALYSLYNTIALILVIGGFLALNPQTLVTQL